MSQTTPQGEVRPPVTPGDLYAEPFVVPLLRLRQYDRTVIQPADCRVKDCLVCAWRLAGLLSSPVAKTPVVMTSVVREGGDGYCVSDHCPGCGAWLACRCPPTEHLDAHIESSYMLGFEHGTADGPEHRPSRRWVVDADLDLSYLDGYDHGCANVAPQYGHAPVPSHPLAGPLWDPSEPDGLPF